MSYLVDDWTSSSRIGSVCRCTAVKRAANCVPVSQQTGRVRRSTSCTLAHELRSMSAADGGRSAEKY
jgi:hypothetical protein